MGGEVEGMFVCGKWRVNGLSTGAELGSQKVGHLSGATAQLLAVKY